MKTHVTQENYRHMRRKGCQNLRVLLVLFFMFLLCDSVLGYFIVKVLLEGSYNNISMVYLVRAGSMLMLWLFITRLLWRFRKVGRTLFTLMSIASLYSLYDIYQLQQITIENKTDNILRYLFMLLICFKTILIIGCMLKMRSDAMMRCIWSTAIIYEDALDDGIVDDEEEEEVLQEIPFHQETQTPLILRLPQESPLVKTARKHLRFYAFGFTFLSFGGFLLTYILMLFIQWNYRNDPGILYIQRMSLLTMLYSVLVWMFPITLMFFYHKATKALLWIAWLCELLHVVTMAPEIIEVFVSQKYSLWSAGIFILIECIRYVWFYKLTMAVIKNPFIKAYWSKQLITKERYE